MTRLLRYRLALAYWLVGELFKIVPVHWGIAFEHEHSHANPKRNKVLPLLDKKPAVPGIG